MTIVGVVVNALLVVFKLVVGLLGRSQGLVADGVHSISDLFTDAVVLVGLRFRGKSPDDRHHFGHGRIETLSSAVVGLTLIVVALILGLQAASNILSGQVARPGWPPLIVAALSIVLKEVLYRYTIKVGRRINSPAVTANAWHHRSDALSSVAVLFGIIGARIDASLAVLDPFAAILVSVLILKVGGDITWGTLKEFTDTAPDGKVSDGIVACARAVPGVTDIHDLKVRLAGGEYQMEIHVVVDGNLTVRQGHRIAKEVERCLVEEIDAMGSVIVHIDPSKDDDPSDADRPSSPPPPPGGGR
ncbi:MAG: cation diffusion facilitator family transporter [Proteobacteria bacterium]|nr:cation diffusion facilitator family transporter [Pseudomonadota bacterium]